MMKATNPFLRTTLFFCLVSSLSIISVRAQSIFNEGILVYKVNSQRKTDQSASDFAISQVTVYKKLNLYKIEVIKSNVYNNKDVNKKVFIRNSEGIYSYTETTDSVIAPFTNFAIFNTIEEETLLTSERIIYGMCKVYKVSRFINHTKFLNLPADKVDLQSGNNDFMLEAIVTDAIEIPIESVFESIADLPGTPLKFTVSEDGWMTGLIAVNIKKKILNDELFLIDPNRKIFNADNMVDMISK